MGLLWSALIGLLTGALATALMPGRDPGGLIVTMLLGITGAVVGAELGRASGVYETGEAAGLIMVVVGAMVVILVYGRVRGSRHSS